LPYLDSFDQFNKITGVRINTRQLTKCEWNSGLASTKTKLLTDFFFPDRMLSSNLAGENSTTRQSGERLAKLIHTPEIIEIFIILSN
jgi:hypothetical protein